MKKKTKYLFPLFLIVSFIIAILATGIFIDQHPSDQTSKINKRGISINFGKLLTVSQSVKNDGKILSEIAEKSISPQIKPSPTTLPATATPIKHKVSFVNLSTELIEGKQATFTWTIDGPTKTIHKTTVYFGTVSNPEILPKNASPTDTKYTFMLKEFIDGTYVVPLRFIGNTMISKPGTYFARAYTLIGDKHYWSDERMFKVMPIPKHEIRLISYPDKVKLGENTTFTWEIFGPDATTGFTVIIGSKESKSGTLDESVDIPQTPYKIIVKDFTSGTYSVPFRFIGNATMPEYGAYYIRALAFINGKNIWSNEYSLTVE